MTVATTIACETCGNEKSLLPDETPDRLTCERCGGTTWRRVETPGPEDESVRSDRS